MASNPIRLRAVRDEQGALVKALLSHPNHNGFGKDATGALIPAHFLTEVRLLLNGRPVVVSNLGSGIATDPLFSWRIADARAGDVVTVSWRDNQGGESDKSVTLE